MSEGIAGISLTPFLHYDPNRQMCYAEEQFYTPPAPGTSDPPVSGTPATPAPQTAPAPATPPYLYYDADKQMCYTEEQFYTPPAPGASNPLAPETPATPAPQTAPAPTTPPYCASDISSNELRNCLCALPSNLTTGEIRGCINRLLYQPDESQTDKELFTIVILRKKAKKFNFLEGFTRLWAIGSWRDIDPNGRVIREYPDEENIQIDIEFKDRSDEVIHRGLLGLFEAYNEREVGEQLLYMRVAPLEDSSL